MLLQYINKGSNTDYAFTLLLQVKCVFFTDGLQLEDQQKNELLAERRKFGDIMFSPTETPFILFGERFLYQIMWAKARFKFQYFLRLDDDYFVCMDRLVNELSSRPKANLSWGRYHCHKKHLVYMDESWALFSEDVIEKFLAQDLRAMLCHPFGDQTFTLWINATGVNLTDFDDHRLHYWPPASKLREFISMTNVCDKFMGVHGSYPDLMQYLWRNSNDGPKNITELRLLRNTCSLLKVFDVNTFAGIYKHKPKLCLDKPRWDSKLKSWQGSEKLRIKL